MTGLCPPRSLFGSGSMLASLLLWTACAAAQPSAQSPWPRRFGDPDGLSAAVVALDDGRLLVIGGYTEMTLDGVSLFDPRADTWTRGPALPRPSEQHSATRLPDGRVLVVGGLAGSESHDAVFLYDPEANRWDARRPAPRARHGHAAVLLGDGRLLLVGGERATTSDVEPVRELDVLDIATDEWGTIADIRVTRPDVGASLLSPGRLMLLGAQLPAQQLDLEAGLLAFYDEAAPPALARPGWAELGFGRLVVAGGYLGPPDSTYWDGAALFDGAWRPLPSLPSPRSSPVLVALDDSEVLMVGGSNGARYRDLRLAEDAQRLRLGDPAWVSVGPVHEPRRGHTATRLSDDSVLVVGGLDAGRSSLDTVERFDPTTNRFELVAPLSPGRWGHSATRLGDGRVLVVGGERRGTLREVAALDVASRTWSPFPALPTRRADFAVAHLADGRIAVIGGRRDILRRQPSPLACVEVVDPATGDWSEYPPMPSPRQESLAVGLRDGRLLVVGGRGQGPDLPLALIFDPVTQVWTPSGPTSPERIGHTVSLLPDGRVLVTGGLLPGERRLDPVMRLFDPTSERWTTRGVMEEPRAFPTVVRLPDGRLMFVGGQLDALGVASSQVSIFQPADFSLEPLAPLAQGRFGHAALLLGADRVAVLGGFHRVGDGLVLVTLDSVEIYDAALDRWEPGPDLAISRGGLAAVLAPDNQVLVFGGLHRPEPGTPFEPLMDLEQLHFPTRAR